MDTAAAALGKPFGAVRVMLDGKFVSSDSSRPAPPWTTLRTLEESARKIDAGEDVQDPRWIDVLLAPGSSLGGARPKANVTDEKGALWIAKFPSANDEWDVGAWEYLVSRLAAVKGLFAQFPETKPHTGRQTSTDQPKLAAARMRNHACLPRCNMV